MRTTTRLLAPIKHGVHLEVFGCALVFYQTHVSEQEITAAISELSREALAAVPVYSEENNLDFFFVYQLDATVLVHPKYMANQNAPGTDPCTVFSGQQLARLVSALAPRGFKLVCEDESGFKFVLDPAHAVAAPPQSLKLARQRLQAAVERSGGKAFAYAACLLPPETINTLLSELAEAWDYHLVQDWRDGSYYEFTPKATGAS
ncbi:MAG: hypothetical protein JSS86_12190 [Cyanobacteria bacterium SZAS LIN-2]|nr:hypothetical protein [Cyanobacteria bacterium SZAS LIN-3]MBS1997070.1 hypothetical protein [Cyanobacteria bacterium SZAS LIN-2]